MLSSRLRSLWQRFESMLLFVVVAAVVALIGSWQCSTYREASYRQGFEAGLSVVVLPTRVAVRLHGRDYRLRLWQDGAQTWHADLVPQP